MRRILVCLVLLLPGGALADITQQIDFTFNVSASAPQTPISGSIQVLADETNNNLPTAILSIDLTIDGNVYAVGDVGISASGSTATIGGLLNGPEIVASGGHDFGITYNASTGAPSFFPFTFATPTSGPWQSIPPVPEFTITTISSPAPVPSLRPWAINVLAALAVFLLGRSLLQTFRDDDAASEEPRTER
ncbi:MAG: hypothetical protein AAF430_07130 [Myxococcota bacterium]